MKDFKLAFKYSETPYNKTKYENLNTKFKTLKDSYKRYFNSEIDKYRDLISTKINNLKNYLDNYKNKWMKEIIDDYTIKFKQIKQLSFNYNECKYNYWFNKIIEDQINNKMNKHNDNLNNILIKFKNKNKSKFKILKKFEFELNNNLTIPKITKTFIKMNNENNLKVKKSIKLNLNITNRDKLNKSINLCFNKFNLR